MMRLAAAWRKTSVRRTTRHRTRDDDVCQHLSRPHRRQLIDIPNQQQPRRGRQGTQDGSHQRHIDHRGLVNDQQIAVERRLVAAPKAAGPRIGFEQAMDCLRLDPGALGEALGGTTGGGAERDRDGLGAQNFQQ